MEAADPTFIAVGLLSAGASTAKSANSSIGVWRRGQLRTSFAQYGGGAVALRFLLAPSSLIPASDPTAIAVAPALLREANAHRDMIFLNMTEGLYRCTFKYLEWLRLGPTIFPRARYFVLGDDDIYLSFGHLEADLRAVAAITREDELVLYGLLMWKAYYNNATMATHTGFASWDFFDWSAVAQRRTMNKCRAAMVRRARRARATALPPWPRQLQQRAAPAALSGGVPSLTAVAELSEAALHLQRAAARAVTPVARAELADRANTARAAAAAAQQAHDAELLQNADDIFCTSICKTAHCKSIHPTCKPINSTHPNSRRDDDLLLGQDLYPSATSQRNSRTLPAACAMIRKDHMHAVLTGGVGPLPPFPYIDGPLFAVSAPLARALVSDPAPRAYLRGLARQYAGARSSVYGVSCWPTTDSIFGYWTTAVALARSTPVTLVNSPQHVQHFPWPSWKFSNASVVMHGVRSAKNERFRAHASAYGSGPFVPYERTCGGCEEMGWVTWPNSPLGAWRCCGKRVQRNGARLKACTGKACPDVPMSVLRAVMDGTGDNLMHEYHNYSSSKRQGQGRVRGKGGLRRKGLRRKKEAARS